jgi:hypothetical protein
MSVTEFRRPSHDDEDWFACPTCHRVVAQLLETRYSVGLADLPPRLMCDRCVEGLREAEREYLTGIPFAERVWAIEVVRVIGASKPFSAPPRPAVKPPAARGGVAV